MTSTYRGATRSVEFHLFQEFSTLGQQLAHTLSLRQGLSGVESMFPSRPPGTRQPFGGSGAGTTTSECSPNRTAISTPIGELRSSRREDRSGTTDLPTLAAGYTREVTVSPK